MNETTENYWLYPEHWSSIERLIEELGKIRAMTNQPINIVPQGGGVGFGYKLHFSWLRSLTEEEEKDRAARKELGEARAREARRQQFEKLKKEFGDGPS